MIDSYDSFVYNLVQYLGELGADPIVVRNDQLTVDEALALEPDAVLLSPGPGRPEDAGIICPVVPAFAERGIRVLGVCLGLQAIGHVYGGSIVHAPSLMHGKTSPIEHHGAGVFHDLPSPLTATRYHSLVIDPDDDARDCLEVTATSGDVVMGVRHRDAADRGRAVPPGEHPHRRRSRPAAQLPRSRLTSTPQRRTYGVSGAGVGRRVVARRRVSRATGRRDRGRVLQRCPRSRSPCRHREGHRRADRQD